MKKLTVIAVALFMYCTPYVATHDVAKNRDTNTATPVAPPPPKAYIATFLDTLNSQGEISLEQQDPGKTQKITQTEIAGTNSTTPKYRIQLFASSQIESLREKKRELESSINLPLVIIFETPYYKLLAGNFSDRSEAEATITKLKKMGFTDAWIVTSKANSIPN